MWAQYMRDNDPPLFVPPRIDPLHVIRCQCGHTASHHGFTFNPRDGSINYEPTNMGCDVVDCSRMCRAFDQGIPPLQDQLFTSQDGVILSHFVPSS